MIKRTRGGVGDQQYSYHWNEVLTEVSQVGQVRPLSHTQVTAAEQVKKLLTETGVGESDVRQIRCHSG